MGYFDKVDKDKELNDLLRIMEEQQRLIQIQRLLLEEQDDVIKRYEMICGGVGRHD